MATKNQLAGIVMGLNTGMEGCVSLLTDYPPAILPVIPFNDHIRIGIFYAPVSLGLALLMPHIPKRERAILSLFPFVPFLL